MSRYLVKTLGCKANLYDSQLLEAELQRRGWHPAGDDEAPTLCVVNSCTVTDGADKETRRLAERLARRHPEARVVITGCGAEVDPGRALAVRGVHYVVGNRDKPRLVDLLLEATAGPAPEAPRVLGEATGYDALRSRHPMDREWPLPDGGAEAPFALGGESARTRAFLKVQEGCDAFCTFCIIPYARGPARSLRPREIVARVQALVASGVREVVLTGTNLGDYGTDWNAGPALDALVDAILDGTGLERLRVSSLAPPEITPRLLGRARRDGRLCPHFHVSLQSPHPAVLKGMKRAYRHEEVRECLLALAELPAPVGRPFVGMDVIAGFPGETEAIFEWSVEALAELPWSRLHVFPFSEREGTPATRMAGAPPLAERRWRARVLAELSLARLEGIYRGLLDEAPTLDGLLLEGPARGPDGAKGYLAGHTPGWLRVLVPEGPGRVPNAVVSARPVDVLVDAAAGEAAFVARQV